MGAFWFIYFMTSEQVGTPNQYISVLLDLSFSKGTGIHSFIKYLFSIHSRADTEYTVVSEKTKKKTKPHGTYKSSGGRENN